jgi:hypothetical protein
MEKLMTYRFILSVIIANTLLFSQVSIDSTPKSFNSEESINIPTQTLPSFNVDKFIEEDDIEKRSSDVKPYRFANPILVDFNMDSYGLWTILDDGSSIWQLRIESQGAHSLNLIYDTFDLPAGAEFFVYSNDREMVLGAFTNLNHKPHGGFSTAPVIGDAIILEYNEPAQAEFSGQISVNIVAHDYRDVFFNEDRGYGDSGSCNNNVNCEVGNDWQDQIRSVAMILTSGGSRLCTGSLVNNTSQDLSPYFLTANHCLGGNNSWIFMFNYESSGCSNQNGPTNMTVSGSTLMASSSTSDFALLLLNETPPEDYNVHYAGWDVSGVTPSIPVGIHHPSGDIKKISFDYNNASNSGNFWDIDSWDDGTTEPGSSGSPLFDGLSHRIIGQLYGGVASCTNFGYDTYGKTSSSWNLGMGNYLDANNTGATYLDGMDAIDLPDPELNYSDIDLIFDLNDGDTEVSSLTISNTGEPESVLSYSLKISGFENPMGGPDVQENYWSDSDNEPGLESEWIDISNIGTPYNFTNNDASGASLEIGFDFPFYGELYNECIINPNGWVGFGSDNTEWSNISIPSSSAPRPAIFGFWDDLNPINDNCSSCSGEVYYHTNQERIVVWFNNVSHWPNYFDTSVYDFQIVLYPTGEIKINYNSMIGDFSSATIGMQNSSGNAGLQMSYNSAYAHDNLSTFISKAPEWIGIDDLYNYEFFGELLEGDASTVNIIAQNNGLAEGVYNAYLNISSNASESISLLIELISSGNSLLGDINGDFVVNVLDVIQIVNIALGNQELDEAADVNQDGLVNILDIVQVVNIILES